MNNGGDQSSLLPNSIEYTSESELLNEFHKCMRDPDSLEKAANYLYQSILDETILGVAFEVHYAQKTGLSAAIAGETEETTKPFNFSDMPDIDVFGSSNAKTNMDCACPKCERVVGACRFAPHLEKCMGMGRNSSRIASLRIASSRGEGGNYFETTLSDDEDDAVWTGEKRKKKFQPLRTNTAKRNGNKC